MRNRSIKILKGNLEQAIPYHRKLPFKRLVFVSNKLIPHANIHVAVTFVNNLHKKSKKLNYAQLHTHDVDEINIVSGEQKKLVYEISTDKHKYIVTSPAVVYIPKGTQHAAKPIKGRGTFVCIVFKGTLP